MSILSLKRWWPPSIFTFVNVSVGAVVGYNCDVMSVVEGTSMYPTLEPGHKLIHIARWARELMTPVVPGDVVLVDVDAKITVCKRVIAMGTFDDKVAWEDQHFTDEEMDFDARRRHQSDAWETCQGRYVNSHRWVWLEGDNSRNSFDSREAGAVPIECVKRVVLGVVWPMDSWKRL